MLKAINIKWDTDGDKEVLNELPTEATIPENTEEEDICDYLSDEYGYFVFGFDVVTIKGFRGLFIDGTRSGYAPEQCYETWKDGMMIKFWR